MWETKLWFRKFQIVSFPFYSPANSVTPRGLVELAYVIVFCLMQCGYIV